MTVNDKPEQHETTTTGNTQAVVPNRSVIIRVDMGNLCSPPAFPVEDFPIEIRNCISREEYEKVLSDANDLLATYNSKKLKRVGLLGALMVFFLFGILVGSFGLPLFMDDSISQDGSASSWDNIILVSMVVGFVVIIAAYIVVLVYCVYSIRKLRNDAIKGMRTKIIDWNEALFHERGMSWRVGSEPIVNIVGSGRSSSVYENWNIEISFIERV